LARGLGVKPKEEREYATDEIPCGRSPRDGATDGWTETERDGKSTLEDVLGGWVDYIG